jgi:hypothetical protein
MDFHCHLDLYPGARAVTDEASIRERGWRNGSAMEYGPNCAIARVELGLLRIGNAGDSNGEQSEVA